MKVLVLKSVNHDGSAHGGFVWPTSGKVICPDWNPVAECGGGLHGLLWGEGDGTLLNRSKDARWLVLEVESEKIIDLGGKVKFPECEIVYSGERGVAVEMILERNLGAICCFAKKMVGDKGKVIVGDFGQATAGESGQAIAGFRGKATVGNYGQATAGYFGKAIAGNGGKAIAGNGGKAIAGNGGKAIVGNHGKAIVGNHGKAQCGEGGWIEIKYSDEYRVLVGYAGEEIEANVMYKVQGGKFVKVEQ